MFMSWGSHVLPVGPRSIYNLNQSTCFLPVDPKDQDELQVKKSTDHIPRGCGYRYQLLCYTSKEEMIKLFAQFLVNKNLLTLSYPVTFNLDPPKIGSPRNEFF